MCRARFILATFLEETKYIKLMDESLQKAYLLERRESLKRTLGKRSAIEKLLQMMTVLKMEDNVSLLDVGCGEGHILKFISDRMQTHKIDFYGIDKENIVIRNAQESVLCKQSILHRFKFLQYEIRDKHWTDSINHKFDIIICINVFHEIYSSLIRNGVENPCSMLKEIMSGVFDLLNKNGVILFFDGIRANDKCLNKKIEFEVLNEDTMDKLNQFEKEYLLFHTSFQRQKMKIKSSYKDFTSFITKLRFLKTKTWDIERNETYQYFTEDEYKSFLNENLLQILLYDSFISDVAFWGENVRIRNKRIHFPMEHFYIIGRKS